MAETAAAHAPHGAVEHHDGPSYIAVFVYLTLLTAAELGVYGLGLPKTIMVGALVALALAKATLVAMYFMHLAMERKGLWVVAVTPLVIVAFCYLMLRPDLSRRSWASHQENVVIGHPEGAEEKAQPAQADGAPASGESAPAAATSPAAP
jgi:cytochrome c oxidase subunit IV